MVNFPRRSERLLRCICLAVAFLAAGQFAVTEARSQQFAIDRIIVEGTQRLDADSVRSYMTVREGETASASDINASLRALNATGLFDDVSIEPRDGDLVVRVVERPFINVVAFEGNRSISDELLEPAVRSRSRTVFAPAVVEEDARKIVEAYGRTGRLSATVVPQIIEREGNRVDVVFEIDEGPISRIRRVAFVGNEAFSDSTLRGVVESKQAAWYRIFVDTDRFDPGRVEIDKESLIRFYHGNGYADFRVLSAVSSLTESGSGFVITFKVEEGPRYQFGMLRVVSYVATVQPDELEDLIIAGPGEVYDALLIVRIVGDMLNRLEGGGESFVDVVPVIERNSEDRTVDVSFQVNRIPSRYVERIEIVGNTRTLDSVIRREFAFVEGDPLNLTRLAESRRNIRALGYFGNVDLRVEPGSSEDRVVVRTEVEERSTGSLSFGIGYSSISKFGFLVSLREQNLLGRGLRVGLEFERSGIATTYDVSFTDPYYQGRDLRVGFDLYRRETRAAAGANYSLERTGFSPRLGFPLSRDSEIVTSYTIERRKIRDVTDVSPLLKPNKSDSLRSSLGYRLVWDLRDDVLNPASGTLFTLDQELAGIGGGVRYISAEIHGRYFQPLDRDERIIGSLGGWLGGIRGFGGYQPDAADRFFVGGTRLRGFTYQGVGPRDFRTDEALGGKYYAVASAEVVSNFFFPEELGLRVGLFADAGTVFGLDKSAYALPGTGTPPVGCSNSQGTRGFVCRVDDKMYLRASVGARLIWSSPIGPMQFIFSRPVVSRSGDRKEGFLFTVGTPF